jgi:3-phosphoshikimate 1-carboxyvinyltransferase
MDERTLRFRAPGSKSLTQRALIIAALTGGESQLLDALDSDDTRHLRGALRDLGITVDDSCPDRWIVGGGTPRSARAPLWCGDGGTVLRILAPLAFLVDGELTLDGSARLAERPSAALFDALRKLGVESRQRTPGRSLPVTLSRISDPAPSVAVDSSSSSQFVSGLLLVAPRLPRGLAIEVAGDVSWPYVEMTLAAMRERGAQVRVDREVPGRRLVVAPGAYRPGPFSIEGDWSAAAFLLAAGFVSGKTVAVENVRPDSSQGDRLIAAFLAELAQPREHAFDLSTCPDLLPPLAGAAVFASHASTIGGVAHARLKESDRVATLAQNLARAGVAIEERPDGLRLDPARTSLHAAALDPRGDHRMAMTTGLLGLREPGIVSGDRGCVSKSYPGFWDELARFR